MNYLKRWKFPPMTYYPRQTYTPFHMVKNGNVRIQSVQKYQTEIKHEG